ncbi:MAG: cyclase [Deltaproteobacteria bacterium CG11_big_fil_rev_8_21_14_0_20_49_13]|nr:MAG: cyclase [Deltaproteobacteria bacterium CG11_big_fil_rev_8_21_14_0_20_49_13]
MPAIKRSITVNASPKEAFDVVSDFESYPKFLPEILDATVIKKNSKEIVVRFKVELLLKSEYTLKFHLKHPSLISWELVKGDNMKSNTGEWSLEPEGKNRTKLTYSVEVQFGWLVPKAVAEKLIESHLPKMLKNFKTRIDERE